MKATKTITATGEAMTVEAGEDRCWASEEVVSFPIDVPEGTACDVCEMVISDDDADAASSS